MPDTKTTLLKQLTPVIMVDEVEPCVAFWVDRLGFTQTNQVPGEDGRLVFAIIERDGIELMYQTKASAIADMPDMRDRLDGRAVALFITVNDLDAIEAAVGDAPVLKPRHRTFYGSSELYIQEPGGSIVGFAQF